MKDILLTFVFFIFTSLFLISCSDSGPTIGNNNTSTNSAPNSPTNPFPRDSATNVNRDINLSWLCSDPDEGDTLRYDVRISFENPPDVVICRDITSPFCSAGLVDPNTTFYWRVTAKDNKGAVTSGPIWRFRTGN